MDWNEEAACAIAPGLYQHFKGNYYKVLYIARHSETTELMVVYRALYGDGGVWVRPAAMWNENVERGGQVFPRFRKLSRKERIAFYEAMFDEVISALSEKANVSKDSCADSVYQKLKILEDYYTSGQWRADYEADEQGLLPADIKRGVLSQDALFDLLAENDNP